MANPIFHLFQLQKIDLRVDFLHKRLAEISAILNNNSACKLIEEKLDQIDSSLSICRRKYNDLEEKINNKKLKIEQSESSLYGGTIKNPKELQDIQFEIQSIKNTISNLEDDQLQKLIELESVEKEKADVQEEKKILDSRLSIEYSSLSVEASEINSELSKLENERNAVLSQISSEFLNTYVILRKTKNGIALSSIEENCCTACGSTLTPSECQNAKSPSHLINCPSCGRILYAG